MMVMPVALLGLFGHRWQDVLALRWDTREHWRSLLAVGMALLAFQAVFGRGLTTLGALQPDARTLAWTIPLCFVWLIFEVGFSEEVPYRVILQSQLSAALNSEWAAIFLATLTWSAAHSVAIISPAGLLFGVLWSCTRSLLLLVVLHATIDLLPNLAEFIENWR